MQLINDDYGEFIALGTGLRGEGERLERLEKPLGELRGQVEVRCLQLNLSDDRLSATYCYHIKRLSRTSWQNGRHCARKRYDFEQPTLISQTLLNLLLHLSESLSRTEALLAAPRDGKTVSRVANEYTQLVYLVAKAKAEGCAYANEVETVRNATPMELMSEDHQDQVGPEQ